MRYGNKRAWEGRQCFLYSFLGRYIKMVSWLVKYKEICTCQH